MSEISHSPYTRPSDGVNGYTINLPVPDYIGIGTASVVVIANSVSGNGIYLKSFDAKYATNLRESDKDRAGEELEGIALRYLSDKRFDVALSTWADKVLNITETLWMQFVQNNFRETELYVDGEFFCVVAPCFSLGFDCNKKSKENATMSDIEYYLVTDGNEINGGKSLYELANQCTNKEYLNKNRVLEQEALQNFYNINIYPIRNTSVEDMTNVQKELNVLYSDWHEKIYGYRPVSKSVDMCFKSITANGKQKGC